MTTVEDTDVLEHQGRASLQAPGGPARRRIDDILKSCAKAFRSATLLTEKGIEWLVSAVPPDHENKDAEEKEAYAP